MKTSTSTSRTLAATAVTATLALAGLAAASAPALAHSDSHSHSQVRVSGHGDDDPAGDDHGGRGRGDDDNGSSDDHGGTRGGDDDSSTGGRGGDDNGGGRGGRDDDRVIRTGDCSSVGTWKLKVKTDDGRLEVEGEVDTNRAGQAWVWTISQNGSVASRGSATTGGRSGSFSVERKVPNPAGADRIVFRATRDGNVCQGSLTF